MHSQLLLLCVMSVTIGCTDEPEKSSYLLMTDTVVREVLPEISRSRVKKLQIERATLSEEHLAIIGSFENLEYLRLIECEIDDSDLRHFAKLANLKRLELPSRHVTDAGLIHLAELHSLESLRLSSKHLTGRGFHSLTSLKSLRSLDLNGCAIDDDGMKHIEQFQGLRTLWLMRTHVTDVGLMRASNNYWLLNVIPSKHMTVDGMRTFRKTLLDGRRQARAKGLDVPPDDTLFIQTADPEARGAPPAPDYPKKLDKLRGQK